MTHRTFSRNASSSRAIPVQRMIEGVVDNPATPLVWTYNEPGMQGTQIMSEEDSKIAWVDWQLGCAAAVNRAQTMADRQRPAHKQIINRILEPYMHIKVLVTATDFANWFALRDHPAAEPHIQLLAQAMQEAMDDSMPTTLEFGEWHMPYLFEDDVNAAAITALEEKPSLGEDEEALADRVVALCAKISTARCARVSYNNHDGTRPKFLKDLQLYRDLMSQTPLHASPSEHVATPDRLIGPTWERPDFHGNFYGWKQYRKYHANEVAHEPNR